MAHITPENANGLNAVDLQSQSPDRSIVSEVVNDAYSTVAETAFQNALANLISRSSPAASAPPASSEFLTDASERVRKLINASVDSLQARPVEQEPIVSFPDRYRYSGTLSEFSGTVRLRVLPTSRNNEPTVIKVDPEAPLLGVKIISADPNAVLEPGFDWYYFPSENMFAARTNAVRVVETSTPAQEVATAEPIATAPPESGSGFGTPEPPRDGTTEPVATPAPAFERQPDPPTQPPETPERVNVSDPTRFEIPHTAEDLRYNTSFEVNGLSNPVRINVWFDQDTARQNNFRIALPTPDSRLALNQISSEYLSGVSPTVNTLSIDSQQFINRTSEASLVNMNAASLDLSKIVEIIVVSQPLNTITSPISGQPLISAWFMDGTFQYYVGQGNQIYIYPGNYPFVPDPDAPVSMDTSSEAFKGFSLTRSYTVALGLIQYFSDLNKEGIVDADDLEDELARVINRPSNVPSQLSTTDMIQDFRTKAIALLPTLVAP